VDFLKRNAFLNTTPGYSEHPNFNSSYRIAPHTNKETIKKWKKEDKLKNKKGKGK
jgi:hypothetical protein